MCGVQQYPLMIAESPILRIVFGALGLRCVYLQLAQFLNTKHAATIATTTANNNINYV
jgi:hypothetical protein